MSVKIISAQRERERGCFLSVFATKRNRNENITKKTKKSKTRFEYLFGLLSETKLKVCMQSTRCMSMSRPTVGEMTRPPTASCYAAETAAFSMHVFLHIVCITSKNTEWIQLRFKKTQIQSQKLRELSKLRHNGSLHGQALQHSTTTKSTTTRYDCVHAHACVHHIE